MSGHNYHDVILKARAIYEEAGASLDIVGELEAQSEIPSVEASDFRASLKRIRELAATLEGDT